MLYRLFSSVPRRVFLGLLLAAAAPAWGRQAVIPGTGLERSPHEDPRPSVTGDPVAALGTSIFIAYQAKDGTSWFGSDGQGVYRYDGKAIVHFTTAHGLRGNRIRSIQEDRAGNILVGGEGGVSRFDGRAFRGLDAANADPAKGEWKLDAGDLWFTGWQDEGVVYRYDGTSLHRLAFPKTKPGEEHIARYPRAQFPAMAYNPYDVYTIYRDSRGHVWFGTGTLGVCRYDGRTFAWASRDELDFGADDGFGVRSIVEGKDGRFWFSRTLHRFEVAPSSPAEHGTIPLTYRKEPGIGAALADEGAGAGEGAGVGAGRRGGLRGFTHIMSAVKDKDGDVWMATIDGNVWRYDGTNAVRYPVREGDAVVRLYSISIDRHGGVWLGTHEHGAYRFDGKEFGRFSP